MSKRAPLPQLLLLLCVLALAVLTPAALARTHRAACSAHATPHGHAAHACSRAPSTSKHHKARHLKHTTKRSRLLPRQSPVTQAAICEDGSTPSVTAAEASCADGSEPSCENGSTPVANAAGALQCPASATEAQGDAAQCGAEGCTFDSEGPAAPKEEACETCAVSASDAEAES